MKVLDRLLAECDRKCKEQAELHIGAAPTMEARERFTQTRPTWEQGYWDGWQGAVRYLREAGLIKGVSRAKGNPEILQGNFE